MSYESSITRSASISKKTRRIQEKQSSPLMFDEDLFSAEFLTQVNQQSVHNRVISNQKSSEEWIVNAEIKPNAPRSLVHLSMSPIEVVTTCAKCEEMNLNSNENHNRTFNDITETIHTIGDEDDDVVETATHLSPKRARLSKPTELAETYDFLKNLIDDQTKTINDQLSALQEDSAKHLMMVNYINSSAENLDDRQNIG